MASITSPSSRQNSIWTRDEQIQLLQTEKKLEEIQLEVESTVRGVLCCSQALTTFPSLLGYKPVSTMAPESSFIKMEGAMDKAIAAIQESISVRQNVTELGKMVGDIRLINPENSAISCDNCLVVERLISKIIVFLRDSQDIMVGPSLFKAFFQVKAKEGECEQQLNDQIKMLEKLRVTMSQISMKTAELVMKAYPQWFSTPVAELTMTVYKALEEGPKFRDTNNPLGIGIAIRSIQLAKASKEFFTTVLSPEKINGALASELEVQQRACELLSVADLEKARKCINNNELVKHTPSVKFSVYKFLAENDPIYGEFFKRRTCKLMEKTLERGGVAEQREKEEEEIHPEDCVIQ